MTLVFCANEDPSPWREEMARRRPDLAFEVWPQLARPDRARYLLAWGDIGAPLAALPGLEAVFVLGAGVEAVTSLAAWPDHVALVRLHDAGMGAQMAQYATHWALHFQRDMDHYDAERGGGHWRPRPYQPPEAYPCGILGLGTLGRQAASGLQRFGFPVRGWSAHPKSVPGIDGFVGAEGLAAFLAGTRLLFCLLPLTPATRGILNRPLFDRLADDAVVVNMARGGHLIDADLLDALDRGRLRAAVLDVTSPEPLPADHPFRSHPRIRLTPHIAAATVIDRACAQICTGIAALEAGTPPPGLVDRTRGY